MGYLYIDTGAMYRAVALKANERSVRLEEESLSSFAASVTIEFHSRGEEIHIFCDGEDVTEAIRDPEIGTLASEISKRKGVREALVHKQREMGRTGGVVLEGRDIGTVVFPDADVKFYLDADPKERAKRRFDEWIRKGIDVNYEKTLEELMKRDHNDMNRLHSPLKQAEDALRIDSTGLSAEEVVEEMLCKMKEKLKDPTG